MSLKKINDSTKTFENSNNSFLTRDDLAEIELASQSTNLRNLMGKGSRFTLGEKLQFTKVN
jgi:hypothetical protein